MTTKEVQPPWLGGYAWRKEDFDEAFTDPVTREPYQVPDDIRRAAERIVSAYMIRGICDPMYVANLIAKETGRGELPRPRPHGPDGSCKKGET